LKTAIRDYSRAEYAEITGQLCAAAQEVPPLVISDLFAHWFAPNGPLSDLREEYESYVFKPENFVVRHLFAHFLAFQEDKFRRPEFFCWPGAWMAGERVDSDSDHLFHKHGALFGDKEDDDAIFPRIQRGRDDGVVHKTFDTFYQYAVTYDLVNQWISEPGPFRYDAGWLKPSASREDMKSFLRGAFRAAFKLDPEDVQVIA
jgi:hypothetical protein